jgi:hypothetical protein
MAHVDVTGGPGYFGGSHRLGSLYFTLALSYDTFPTSPYSRDVVESFCSFISSVLPPTLSLHDP